MLMKLVYGYAEFKNYWNLNTILLQVPEHFEIYCPDKDNCVTTCEELLDVLDYEDRQQIVKRLEVKYLTPKGEDK